MLRSHEGSRIAASPIVDIDRTEARCLSEVLHRIARLIVWVRPSLSDGEGAARFEHGVTVSQHCRAIGDFAEYGAQIDHIEALRREMWRGRVALNDTDIRRTGSRRVLPQQLNHAGLHFQPGRGAARQYPLCRRNEEATRPRPYFEHALARSQPDLVQRRLRAEQARSADYPATTRTARDRVALAAD